MQKNILLGGTLVVLLAVGIFGWMNANPSSQEDNIVPPEQTSGKDSTPRARNLPLDNEGEEAVFAGEGIHLTVHLEPSANVQASQAQWETDQRLVELADEYGMKLSLHFSAQMAEFVLDDAGRLETVRGWEANGHELGSHHHGLSHRNWDGYSNDPKAKTLEGYQGTIEDMMNPINRLPASGQVLVGSGTDQNTDWPEGVVYATDDGLSPNPKYLISQIQEETWTNVRTKVLLKAPFGVDQVRENVEYVDIEEGLSIAKPSQYLGLVVADNNLTDSEMEDLESVFQLFQNWNLHTQTIQELLGT